MFRHRIIRRSKIAGRILSVIAYGIFLVTAIVMMLELVYRQQWIEFYGSELKALNTAQELENSSPEILVIGDSFSAFPESYILTLKDSAEGTVINSSVSGTGIIQHNLIADRRLNSFDPKIVLYQMYVGNDFTDIRHPISTHNTVVRNMYWWFSDRIRILSFMNYRLAGIASSRRKLQNTKDDFQPDQFSKRERTLIAADPNHLYTMLTDTDNYLYLKWRNAFDAFLEKCGDRPVYLLIIPHASMVNKKHQKIYSKLGMTCAELTHGSANIPLYRQIRKDFPNVRIIDPLAYFQEQETPMYFTNDLHLSPAGQELLGHYVWGQIKAD